MTQLAVGTITLKVASDHSGCLEDAKIQAREACGQGSIDDTAGDRVVKRRVRNPCGWAWHSHGVGHAGGWENVIDKCPVFRDNVVRVVRHFHMCCVRSVWASSSSDLRFLAADGLASVARLVCQLLVLFLHAAPCAIFPFPLTLFMFHFYFLLIVHPFFIHFFMFPIFPQLFPLPCAFESQPLAPVVGSRPNDTFWASEVPFMNVVHF